MTGVDIVWMGRIDVLPRACDRASGKQPEVAMNVRYLIELSEDERTTLTELTRRGTPSARSVKRAQILLMADQGALDIEIAGALAVGASTIYRIKRRFVEDGLDRALSDDTRPGGERKLKGKEEALLVAIACSKPPEGRAKWTLQLLADAVVALTDLDSVSCETIRRRLAEKEIKPWQKKMWCIPKFDSDFVAHMENVLDLYAEPADPSRPVVCFDETLKMLVADVKEPLPPRPGSVEKYDYHYRRNGTANLFVFFDRHRCWRKVKVTDQKTNVDFAECMRDLVDIHYPSAQLIRVVLDNLSTHRERALYDAFPPEEARRILRRIEFHHTPKHASWLNMVEIEIGVLNRQCLDRRIADPSHLRAEVAAWERDRNEEGATINWLFSLEQARKKLARAYPLNQSQSLC
jgi:transposase